MSKPVVAIVGRPNVGKSTLFNALAGERISIVQDTPGVTRDRIYAEVSWLDHNFTMIDTGGIEPDSNDIILSQMREQAEIAIATADVIMFIVDVRDCRIRIPKLQICCVVPANRSCWLSIKWTALKSIWQMSMSSIILESEIRSRFLPLPCWDLEIC